MNTLNLSTSNFSCSFLRIKIRNSNGISLTFQSRRTSILVVAISNSNKNLRRVQCSMFCNKLYAINYFLCFDNCRPIFSLQLNHYVLSLGVFLNKEKLPPFNYFMRIQFNLNILSLLISQMMRFYNS